MRGSIGRFPCSLVGCGLRRRIVKRGWWPLERGATILEASKTVLRKSVAPKVKGLGKRQLARQAYGEELANIIGAIP